LTQTDVLIDKIFGGRANDRLLRARISCRIDDTFIWNFIKGSLFFCILLFFPLIKLIMIVLVFLFGFVFFQKR